MPEISGANLKVKIKRLPSSDFSKLYKTVGSSDIQIDDLINLDEYITFERIGDNFGLVLLEYMLLELFLFYIEYFLI